MKKVLGFGNALVDVIIPIDNEQILSELDFPKGSMQLIDEEKLNHINTKISDKKTSLVSGGSAANTINGLANMGIMTGFIGKTGNDSTGQFFTKDLESNNITPHIYQSESPSGRAMTFITEDSERTFGTYLGASVELCQEDLEAAVFEGYHYFYVEGYLVLNNALIESGMKMAKEAGMKVVLDLASYNVVESNLDFLNHLIDNYVDIIFSNEEEAKAFCGTAPEEALDMLSKRCEIAIVKIGKEGSLIKRGEEKTRIGIIGDKCVDTTGAGDLYAAGFLFGLINDWKLSHCGIAGAVLSGHVVEVYGAKISEEKWLKVKEMVAGITTTVN